MAVYDVSPAEFLIIRLLHEVEECDLAGLVQRANQERDVSAKEWTQAAVQCFLARLMQKGYVDRRKQWGRWIYRNKVSVLDTLECFLSRFLGPAKQTLLFNYLMNGKKISKKEEKLLQELLNAPKREGPVEG